MRIPKFAGAIKVQLRDVRWLAGAALLLVALSAPAQNLFVSSIGQNTIYVVTPGGTISTFVQGITDPTYMAFNSSGDLFVDSASSIYEITPGGKTNIFATGISDLGELAINSAGDIFAASGNVNGSIIEITPNGVESTFASGLDIPVGLTFNSAGDLLVSTHTNITEITPGGVKSVFTPGLSEPGSLVINGGGYVFAETGLTLTEISPTGSTATSFTSIPSGSRQLILGSGGLLLANQTEGEVLEFNPNGEESVFAPGINGAYGLAIQPVPEPSVMGLLAAGAMILFARRRR